MPIRTRLVGAVAVVVAASASLALLPGTANAATPARAADPLTVSATPAQPGPLLPGGKAKSFDFTVTNHSGKAVAFAGELVGGAHGALPMHEGLVKLVVQAVHAPATAYTFGSQDGGFIGAVYPKGGHWGSKFTIPAHATYTWKVTVEATKAFPLNDDRLVVGLDALNGTYSALRVQNFHIGPFSLDNGGPIVTTVTGGKYVNVTAPLVLDVRYTNRTGAALAEALHPWVVEARPANGQKLAFDVWNGKGWVPAGTLDAPLPAVRAGLANGASVTERIRVRIVGRADLAYYGQVALKFGYAPFGPLTTKVVTTSNQ
ncbi:hypothetical protein ABH931_003564 [Streptacidiphilus sp. MAP12-33]|uniref:hypothetical protein n=1 Tax=Streptacidiphilus sp. MAP12-33 TaxID=3156266 RepID=UPI003514CE33